MKELNVIDFDKTLIPVDSFRLFVIHGIKKYYVGFILLSLLRSCRIISSSSFKNRIIKLSDCIDRNELYIFIDNIMELINPSVLKKINSYTNSNTINILCSASPDFYISPIAEKLNMIGKGSYITFDNKFYHMYGINKVKFLLSQFPQSDYTYKFAISDSESDLELLSMFEDHLKL